MSEKTTKERVDELLVRIGAGGGPPPITDVTSAALIGARTADTAMAILGLHTWTIDNLRAEVASLRERLAKLDGDDGK